MSVSTNGTRAVRTGIHRILVPVDFSPASDEALGYARALAGRVGASLELLHVVEDPAPVGGLMPEAYITSTPAPTSDLEKAARVRLAERANRGDTWNAVCGRAAPAIVDYAASRAVDLIVMGTQGRTGIAHLIIGSVAEGVVRTAPCPVLTIKPVAVGSRV